MEYYVKGGVFMPNIKPVSDLRNYNEVLRDITVGEPVFLTKNGRGRYAILDIDDFKKMQATIKLFNELMEAEKSIKENALFDENSVKKFLGLKNE